MLSTAHLEICFRCGVFLSLLFGRGGRGEGREASSKIDGKFVPNPPKMDSRGIPFGVFWVPGGGRGRGSENIPRAGKNVDPPGSPLGSVLGHSITIFNKETLKKRSRNLSSFEDEKVRKNNGKRHGQMLIFAIIV